MPITIALNWDDAIRTFSDGSMKHKGKSMLGLMLRSSDDFGVSKSPRQYLQEFIKLCGKKKFRVVIVSERTSKTDIIQALNNAYGNTRDFLNENDIVTSTADLSHAQTALPDTIKHFSQGENTTSTTQPYKYKLDRSVVLHDCCITDYAIRGATAFNSAPMARQMRIRAQDAGFFKDDRKSKAPAVTCTGVLTKPSYQQVCEFFSGLYCQAFLNATILAAYDALDILKKEVRKSNSRKRRPEEDTSPFDSDTYRKHIALVQKSKCDSAYRKGLVACSHATTFLPTSHNDSVARLELKFLEIRLHLAYAERIFIEDVAGLRQQCVKLYTEVLASTDDRSVSIAENYLSVYREVREAIEDLKPTEEPQQPKTIMNLFGMVKSSN